MGKSKKILFAPNAFMLWIMIFVGVFLPFIVRAKGFELSGVYFENWVGAKSYVDFFSFYKMVIFLILGIAMIIAHFSYSSKNLYMNIDKKRENILIAVYSIFVLLSTIFSNQKMVSTWGFLDRFEGMFVLLAYMIIFFTIANSDFEEVQIRKFIKYLFGAGIIMTLIGISQYIGKDIFRTRMMQSIILPPEYASAIGSLNFVFEKNNMYGTLYHYNYVGSYGALLLPIFVSIALFLKEKKMKIAGIIGSIFLLILLVGSTSRAGLLGGIAAIIVMVLFSWNKIIKNWKISSIVVVLGVVAIFGGNIVSKGALFQRISTVPKEFGIFFSDGDQVDYKKLSGIEKIDIKKGNAKVIISGQAVDFGIEGTGIYFKNPQGEKVPIKGEQDGTLLINDPSYSGMNIKFFTMENKTNIMQIIKGNIKMYFKMEPDKISLVNDRGIPLEYKDAPHIGFKGKEKLASARGYIWSRTFPMLKNSIIKGYGPDTFVIEFPQYDVYAKLYSYGDMWMKVDKPHNLYVQIFFSTGLISLLSILGLVGLYIISSFKLYMGKLDEGFLQVIGFGCFVGVIGYLGAGIFNDSVISVAPVFWTIFGLGVSINGKLLKN